MSDNIELPTQENDEENGQAIFEERFAAAMNQFREVFREMGIDSMITIAKHSEHDEPMVFFSTPHVVDAASLMAGVLRQIKTELYSELDTEPRK